MQLRTGTRRLAQGALALGALLIANAAQAAPPGTTYDLTRFDLRCAGGGLEIWSESFKYHIRTVASDNQIDGSFSSADQPRLEIQSPDQATLYFGRKAILLFNVSCVLM